ncbi:MAG: hypothetical protein ACE5JG_04145, partial [Planctomycetota bacterium]
MPRVPALLLLVSLVAGCAQEGPRDRSLLRVRTPAPAPPPAEPPPEVTPPKPKPGKPKEPETSLAGLVPDSLSRLYPREPLAVVRFDDLVTLKHTAGPRLEELRYLLPELPLPTGSPLEILREAAHLPAELQVDDTRPFAFVLIEEGWTVLLPVEELTEAEGLRPLDEIYLLAGPEAARTAYEPDGHTQQYLRGHVSVRLAPPAYGLAREVLGRLAGPLALDLPDPPEDFRRLDFACQFGVRDLRVDFRAAARRGSTTAALLGALEPKPSRAVRLLPPEGAVYLEWTVPPDLVRKVTGRAEDGGVLSSLWTGDLACVLDLDQQGNTLLVLVAQTPNPETARRFWESETVQSFLTVEGEDEPRLRWTPAVFERHGISIGSLTGEIPEALLDAWKESGNPIIATAAFMLHGPIESYSGAIDDKIFLIVGHRSRSETERYLDRVR